MPTPPDFTAGTALAAASLNKIGLWEIASKTWTSTTNAQQIDSCFTSSFDNYRLVLTATSNQSTPAYMYYQMVDGTTAYAGAQYFANPVYSFTGGAPTANWNTFVTVGYAGWIGDNEFAAIHGMDDPAHIHALVIAAHVWITLKTLNIESLVAGSALCMGSAVFLAEVKTAIIRPKTVFHRT